jgi:hypothetical protein
MRTIPVYPFKFVIPAAGFMLLLQGIVRSSAASNASDRCVAGAVAASKKSTGKNSVNHGPCEDEDMATGTRPGGEGNNK